MSQERTLCILCAWRETCKKQFNQSPSPAGRCPDYSKDLAVKKAPDTE